MNTIENRKVKMLMVTGVLMATMVGWVGGYRLVTYLRGPSEPISQIELEQIAADLSGQLPMMVDEISRLEVIEATPGLTLTYRYTLLTGSNPEFDINANIPQIRSGIESSSEMKNLFRAGVTAAYEYFDSDGNLLGNFAVTPEDAGVRTLKSP